MKAVAYTLVTLLAVVAVIAWLALALIPINAFLEALS